MKALMIFKTVALSLLVTGAVGLQSTAHADDGDDSAWSQLLDGSVSGRARLYDYRHWDFENAPYPNQPQDSGHDDQATFLGGDLLVRSGSLAGFSAGLSVFTQQRIIDYAVPNTEVLPTNQLAESFLQFQSSMTQFKFGRQMMSTPFANADMFTLTTRSFYGLSGSLHLLDSKATPPDNFDDRTPDGNPPSPFDTAVQLPFQGDSKASDPDLKVYFARMTRYESRFSDEFTDTNRYGPGLNAADPAIPATTSGFFTLGAQYQQGLDAGDVMARAWYYEFHDYAQLEYLEGGFQLRDDGPRPFVTAQYTHESDSGDAFAGSVDATLYGLQAGLNFSEGDVALVGEWSPDEQGTFRNGGLLHPYTDFSGVLYDDTLNDGLENLGPGHALGIQGDLHLSKQLSLHGKLVHYVADYGTNGSFYDYSGPMHFSGDSLLNGQLVPDQSSNGLDLGAIYKFSGDKRGFSLGDDIDLRNGFGGRNTFAEDRLRLVYTF
ncbi:MAG TPA: hypothetical protein VGN70_08595 [Gammaproteobacteria bacterium]